MFGGRGTGRKRRLSRQRVSPGEKLPSGWLLLPDAQDNAEKQYINTVNHTLARRDRKITVHHNNGRFNGELPRREWTNSPLSFRQKLPSYGDPGSQRRRNGQVPSMNTLVEIIHHRHAFDKATRVRLRDNSCNHRDTQTHFCDVLGPTACSRCIESDGRLLAKEAESDEFEVPDISAASLVAPSLAGLLTSRREGTRSRLGTIRRTSKTKAKLKFPRLVGLHKTRRREPTEACWQSRANDYVDAE
ncbi:hypothetical protein NP493_216g01038 [Ridgeia piscesae]|uniref:Uncharacterized protein n=1 Tax=Ridgeia piscesae TaxID=27915 RepID=A0AAD9UE30_RIDPI|nr:hypothetical protein NP493_216g01038 [Ridgeia piscesae]